MFRRILGLNFLVLLSLGVRAADAGECVISGPPYRLQSDTVEWQMNIASGQSCIRGIRFSDVVNPAITIISPPKFGQVTLLGPAFSYAAKSDFRGQDFFTVGVSGAINRASGTSTIRVLVSIGDELPASPALAVPQASSRAAGAAPGLITPAIPSIDNDAALPAGDASLPPCPKWDWSTGSPPPMRPPFDRSKLYCPPPPFNPRKSAHRLHLSPITKHIVASACQN